MPQKQLKTLFIILITILKFSKLVRNNMNRELDSILVVLVPYQMILRVMKMFNTVPVVSMSRQHMFMVIKIWIKLSKSKPKPGTDLNSLAVIHKKKFKNMFNTFNYNITILRWAMVLPLPPLITIH